MSTTSAKPSKRQSRYKGLRFPPSRSCSILASASKNQLEQLNSEADRPVVIGGFCAKPVNLQVGDVVYILLYTAESKKK